MKEAELARLFYREIAKVDRHPEWGEVEKIRALHRLLNLIFVELTRKERLQFSTFFARMAYVCHQGRVDKRLQFFLHHFRKLSAGKLDPQAEQHLREVYALGVKVLAASLEHFMGAAPPADWEVAVSPSWPLSRSPADIQAFLPKVRVLAVGEDPEAEQLLVKEEERPEEIIRVQYNLAERNENFNATIDAIRQVFGFPVNLNLLQTEVDVKGVYRPRAIVVEPDYLVDVTAIAECFQPHGTEPLLGVLKKYLPKSTNKNLMLGNIANFFLDELMTHPELTFKALFPKVFQLNPLAFCLFEDREIREMMQRAQLHYAHLKRMVQGGFAENGIRPRDCFLEPTFYSETYGLQGRLDLFHRDDPRSAIVELKSGKPFRTNIYGINHNHFTQTLLYDLLIRDAFGNRLDPANYILYSSQSEKTLRFAPRIVAQQYEALQVRNQILATEWRLRRLGQDSAAGLLEQGRRFFRQLHPGQFPQLKGFHRQDLAEFSERFEKLTDLEQKYFTAFSGFVAREHQLAKTGVQGMQEVNGQAGLWLNGIRDKEDGFEIISHLQVKENRAAEEEQVILFAKTEHTNDLANFRQGDIAVMYGFDGERLDPLSNQLFKCTILDIQPDSVKVRLRSRQFNDSLFRNTPFWNLEHDLLDSSFLAHYRGLYAFADSPADRRALLLGLRAPRQNGPASIEASPELTQEQRAIFRQAVAAEDYFLLWGPPGTGKTSMMLKHLVGRFLEHSQENLLLLAYTNRAVDEICEAIEQLGEQVRNAYLRIGSRYATGPRFRERLLSVRTEKATSRRELRDLIDGHRIIVATVSSIAGKPELLQLKSFDRVIIDEASQILEPMLVGLLTQFRRFILIGDHKQLPAVVTQAPEASAVEDADLRSIGLNNLRNSLFERLFKRCQQQGWSWAYAQLSHQGRMHREIMQFPNQHFYDGSLKILPEELPFHQRQIQALSFAAEQTPSSFLQQLCRQRVAFLPTPPDEGGATLKTNRHEAEKVVDLVMHFRELYQQIGRSWSATSVGIITPYRAQIAQIRSILAERELDSGGITIDTVERYQGGARDVILISLCTNSMAQIYTLSSPSEEGVDRKLNVALTRAREQLVILGNPELLRASRLYRALMAYCKVEEER